MQSWEEFSAQNNYDASDLATRKALRYKWANGSGLSGGMAKDVLMSSGAFDIEDAAKEQQQKDDATVSLYRQQYESRFGKLSDADWSRISSSIQGKNPEMPTAAADMPKSAEQKVRDQLVKETHSDGGWGDAVKAGMMRSGLSYMDVDAEQIESIISTFNDMGIQVFDQAPASDDLIMSDAAPTVAADEDAEEEASIPIQAVAAFQPFRSPLYSKSPFCRSSAQSPPSAALLISSKKMPISLSLMR